MIISKELIFSKIFNEDEKINYRNNLFIQYNDAAADKWKEKKWKNDKCWREVDEECKNEKSCWERIFKEERKFWYNDI